MKKIVGFCLLIVSVLLSVSCTFAASGFGGGSRGDGWGSGGFSTGTTSTEVSYDALSSLALELNDRLASGEFGDVLKEVSCNIGVYSTVSGRDKYAIFYHYQASNYWYRNASGGLVYAYKDIDRISDLLGGNNGGIAYFLNRMEYVLTGSLLTAVNSINTATNSLLTTCNTISAKLDTLTSVISNGKVLVDNSDVVSAIQSIPAFDDTELLDRVGTIVEQIDTLSRKIDLNYFPNMYKQVTSIADTLGNTNKHLITGNRHTSEIIDMLTAAVDADTGKLLVDNSDVVSAIQSIPAYDDSTLISAVTTISDQITEQFGEYDSAYAFPNFFGQSSSSNKTVSGVLPSAFTSIDPGSRYLLYSPSSALTLSKSLVYSGGSICQAVYCSPYISQTYGLGYQLNFTFRFSYTRDTSRSETVQFPKFSFTDYSGKTLTSTGYTGTVRVPARSSYAYTTSYYFPRWDTSGNWLGWSGQNDTFRWTSSTYEPSKRVYLTPPESGTYYIYGTSDTAIPVVYASRFTGFLQSQTDRVVNAVGSIPAPTDYTSQLTAVVEKLDALAGKPAVDLTTIESTLSTISDKLDNTASDVNNTIINITNDNDYFSVFYITDGDGNTQSVTDFAGALTGASGKLLSLLYRLVFADALGSVDGDLGNMEDFFTSEEPPPATAAMNGDTAPANEVIDVWAS